MSVTASTREQSDLDWAHPLVRQWFLHKFGAATEPQKQGWPQILAGKTTLICAPTGSGKTLAAFLACIDALVRLAIATKLKDQTYVVYVSPLKALSNDVQKNLEAPLAEILALAQEQGIEMQEIRTSVRTGDTLPAERQRMLKHPPHILVTTPESLYILLTAGKSREIMKNLETLIVDEIHALADDKRGAHMALSLERLERLTAKPPIRIGLSATQKPIERVAEFLTGTGRAQPVIVNIGHRRQLDLGVVVPDIPLEAITSNDVWEDIYKRLAGFTQSHRSVLVFVNTRALAERCAKHLGELLGTDLVAAHHGSLSRKLRLEAENKLKRGQIKILVATASLELGIDIGFIDLVCQINTPRSIATCLQRIGRAGHWLGAIPKGRLFATTRDDLVECAALVQAIKQGDLDELCIPMEPLDVLAQQIVAMCAVEDWDEDALYETVCRAYPYKDLSWENFDDILTMLSNGIAARRGRYGAYLFRDRVNKIVKARRGAKIVAVTNGGAIVERAMYAVVAEPEMLQIGTLDEDFAVERHKGDIFLLGNTSWMIKRIESAGRVVVCDAHGAAPTVPFWLGEAPGRTTELSNYVAGLRQSVSEMLPDAKPGDTLLTNEGSAAVIAWLQEQCGLDRSGAEQIIEYIIAARSILGVVPTRELIVAERFFDEGGGMQLVIHSPLGARLNKAWGLALRKRFCRNFDFELQAAATDNGITISLSDRHSFPLADVFDYVNSASVQEVLEQAVLQSPIFGTRFRWDAVRSLALLRFSNGQKVPPILQRLRGEDLMAAVFPDSVACQDNRQGDVVLPDHPLIKEVMKDSLNEALDMDGLKEALLAIESGAIRCLAVDTPQPSQFSHEILNSNPYTYLDDAPLEERRARAVQLRRVLPQSVVTEVGLLDPEAIERVVQEAWPDVRDEDELQDLLQSIVALPEPVIQQHQEDGWFAFMDKLEAQGRATRAQGAEQLYWVAAERKKSFGLVLPGCLWRQELKDVEGDVASKEAALEQMLLGWMSIIGPVTAVTLSKMLNLPARDIYIGLLSLENHGAILRGQFRSRVQPDNDEAIEWCERRLLARIHKLTVGTLRKQIEPVTPAMYMRWLPHWQHVAPGTQLAGERGLLEVLRQLQGFEVPANSWERQVLGSRISHFDGEILDKLCLDGTIGWGRLSPHPATITPAPDEDPGKTKNRRVIPTSVAPIAFFVRWDCDWMGRLKVESEEPESRFLTHAAQKVLEYLRARGASFFADIVRATNLLKSEVEGALWELVAAGLVTADGFDSLRSLIDPKRRAGHGGGRASRPRHSSGRWSLMFTDPAEQQRAVESACWMLLRRYGVVLRDVLARETAIPRWRELLMGFRRLEDRGEIRGGRFISGFLGEQFAMPEALDSLRAMRKREPNGELVTVSAADPLNLVGIIVPGDRIPSNSSRTIVYNDGIPISAM